MIFVTGPAFSGKKEYVCSLFGWSEEEFAEKAVYGVETRAVREGYLREKDGTAESGCPADHSESAEAPDSSMHTDLIRLADLLAEKEVVIASEVGCGIVPVDKTEREEREIAGRLACLLAERADTVVRIVCGLPQVLKGKLPS